MLRFLTVVILSGMAFAQVSPSTNSKAVQGPDDRPASRLVSALAVLPDMPPMPRGKSTVIGGEIREVDGVRDQLTLNVFGGRGMKLLFDERTEVYRDGLRSPLRDLRAGDHVSVETVLDGTTVFARSIHMLSHLPEGECHGQVLKYDGSNGELVVRDSLSPEPVKLRVSSSTTILREGQESSSGVLGPGALVSVQFQADPAGQNVARKIAVLATPGSAFVFTGSVVFLDLHSGLLVLLDPRDNQRYEIVFDPVRSPIGREVHEGTDVTVTADFDGRGYSGRAITMNSPSGK